MKRWFMLFGVTLLAGILLAASTQRSLAADPAGRSILVAQATVPPTVPPSAAQPGRGPNPRFYTVMDKLDQGGSFYLYSDLKGALRNGMDHIKPVLSNPGMPPEALQVYAIADQVVNRLGLYGIYDLGISVVPDGNLNRAKCYISAPEGRQHGLLAILGGEPHPFASLDRASSSTLVVIDADNDTAAAWQLIRQIIQDVAGLAGQTQVDKMLAQCKSSTGLDLEAINASLAGNCCILIDQDPAAQMMLPLPGAPITLNSPRLAVMVKVKDSQLYDALKGQILQHAGPQARPEASAGKLKYIELNIPPNPIWPVSPALATDGDYVYISTHMAYVKQLANPAGALLRDSAEFKSIATGLPAAGNGLAYVSPRLGDSLVKIFASIIAAQTAPGQAANPAMDKIMAQVRESAAGAMTVRVNQPDGVMSISRSKAGAGQYVAALFVAPAAIGAAVALPAFVQARQRAAAAHVQAEQERTKAEQDALSASQAKKDKATVPPSTGTAPKAPGSSVKQ